MKFELFPVLDTMHQFYQPPPSIERFRDYLKLLQGNSTDDMELPIGGYNPMAKEHILKKLTELKDLDAEQIIRDTLDDLNGKLGKEEDKPAFKVVLNVSDDLKGAWTNRYTTDYDSKFKLNALVARNFCTPVFWTSENYDEQKIATRTLEYCYRTYYWQFHPKPQTLGEHIFLEQLVAQQVKPVVNPGIDFIGLNSYFDMHKNSTDYLVIFNFLYGDAAMQSLGNEPKGIKHEFAGYKFAAWLAENNG